jgi:hypothetical protein
MGGRITEELRVGKNNLILDTNENKSDYFVHPDDLYFNTFFL